jgi:hypothetical protein
MNKAGLYACLLLFFYAEYVTGKTKTMVFAC